MQVEHLSLLKGDSQTFRLEKILCDQQCENQFDEDGGSDLLKLANGFLAAFRDIFPASDVSSWIVYGVLSGIMLALQLIAARIMMDTMPTEQIIFSRSVGMCVMLSTVSWGESHRYDAKDMLLYNLYGITNVTGIYVAYIALSFTNIGNVNSVALNLTIPTAIMAYVLLRETVTRCMLGLFLVNVVGIILVSDPHGLFTSSQVDEALRDFYGVVLPLFSMLAMTSSRIVARKTSLRGKIDTSLMTVMSGIVGVPTSLMLSLVRRITWTTPSMTYELI
ncbi:hypothetical protein BSL78_27693 [Apostichopus japonicus]|uniref:EamA domain-containing protein n=1 Tax=Stichopus japonicus TaxID=307972 RepID=A0A2G8JIB8_STIJA|nr:hypothetical protein BSL78_27693 [Apostichopus japonicus]